VSSASGAGGTHNDRVLPDELADGTVPDADLATDDGQLGGNDTVEQNDELDGDVQR
jgi:hypothetical protein